ncbi:MAG TPA: pyridoxamine 5'-phosphate oxidase [Thermoanaerobaculia bacterium]|nr:pyridoxamine 5'-phosphate oxidase [Thermoanaerobaculia bacterium]
MDLSDLRREYEQGGLAEGDLAADPIEQFRIWFAQALAVDAKDANAMTLATADREGRPSARIVLLKGIDERGFVFFTNYESEKARELAENPRAALVFYWPLLDRQVRVEGEVTRTSREESAAYFASRPLGARLGAWASRQSRPLRGREELEQALAQVEARYEGGEVPLPDFWGGYRLAPSAVELWQGRPSRLHDRFRYERSPEGSWRVARLFP